MSREVQYLMTGAGHVPYLLVSLMTLRRHYQGPVTIHAWDESLSLCQLIAEDRRLGVRVERREPYWPGHNKASTYVDKPLVANLPGVDERVFLDADTTIMDSEGVEAIFRALTAHDLVATQFCNWTTSEQPTRGRLAKVCEQILPPIKPYYLRLLMDRPSASLNSGVFGCRPGAKVMLHWIEWTWAARITFIPDETTQHAMDAVCPGRVAIMLGGLWNASHKHGSDYLLDSAFIYHGHGHSFTRADKSPKAVEHWWPLWQECIRDNVGRVRDWPTMHCGNGHLERLMGVRA